MKKQLFFLSLIFALPVHDLQSMQQALAALPSSQDIAARIKNNYHAKQQLRKSLMARGGATVLLAAAAVAFSVVCYKTRSRLLPPLAASTMLVVPSVVSAPAPRPWFSFRSAPVPVPAPPPPPMPIILAPRPNYVGTATMVGLGGSVVGLFKNIDPLWQQIIQFFSLKRDTNNLLKLQERTLLKQESLAQAQEVTNNLLQEKEERDKVRWGENEKKQAEHKHLLDGLYKKMDDMQTELKALMAENTQTHSAEISKVNQSILTLAAQIAEFVKAMTNQPGLITS